MINQLKQEFLIRDLGDLHYFLSLEVHRQSNGILVLQHKYICDLLTRTSMANSNPCLTLIVTKPPLTKNHGSPISQAEDYQKYMGALQYITIIYSL